MAWHGMAWHGTTDTHLVARVLALTEEQELNLRLEIEQGIVAGQVDPTDFIMEYLHTGRPPHEILRYAVRAIIDIVSTG
jgi:hypothetical protein